MKVRTWAITWISIQVIALYIIIGCGSTLKKAVPDIRAIRVTSSMPMKHPSGKILNKKDTVDIFYYEDLVMYRITVLKQHTDIRTDTNANIVKEELKITFAHRYYMGKSGEPRGIWYNSIDVDSGKEMNIDSFLAGKWISKVNLIVDKTIVNDSMVNSQRDKDILTEKYIPRSKIDPSYADSVIFSYSENLKDIPYSFSEKMDRMKQLKLVNIQLIHNNKNREDSGNIDPNVRFHLQELPLAEPKQFIMLFEKAKQDLKNLK